MPDSSGNKEADIYLDDVQCFVESLAYDFKAKIGTLHMPDGSCVDMQGCIALFKKIDPAVAYIRTVAGPLDDTHYTLEADGKWQADPTFGIAARALAERKTNTAPYLDLDGLEDFPKLVAEAGIKMARLGISAGQAFEHCEANTNRLTSPIGAIRQRAFFELAAATHKAREADSSAVTQPA